MPTFLTDENAPLYSSSTDFIDLDPTKPFGFNGAPVANPTDGAKTHAHGANLVTRPRADTFDESIEEESTNSTHASDISDTMTNPTAPNGTRPTSMSSIANGKVIGQSHEDETNINGRNGVNMDRDGPVSILADGLVTSPEPATADRNSNANERSKGPADERPKRNSVSSVAAGSLQQSPVEYYARSGKALVMEDGSSINQTNMSSTAPPTGLLTPPASLTPILHNPDPSKRTHSPHRYSSPPAPTGSATSSLYPAAPGLKHRHTLEVPKLPPGRGSRDGLDSAFMSGRFSPTTATPSIRRPSVSLVRRNTKSLHSDFPRDEIIPDDDARRWAEAYRQKRASKRKRREEEDDDRVLVGTKVDEHHANWSTAYNMLTGIRVSVSRTNAKLDRPLTDADFQAKQKSTFDIAGNELVPSAKYDFKFKDYAPWVFRHLRALFHLDPADYLMSLTGKYILSELGSPGKSGSFFYFSRDYKYIIKTIHHAEHKFLRKILKDYYQHVTNNPNTLLSQFYGLHRVKVPYGKKIHFVVMNNLFPPHRDIHQTFDLKGSTFGRDYKEDDLAKNPRATLKDLNWLRRHRHLELGLQKKRLFLEQLQRDVVLLKRLQIMDYSLLIGIHDLRRGNEENLRDKTLKVFNPGGEGSQDENEPSSVLLRTPSKLEHARKARELRQMIRQERPVPMGQGTKMPDELGDGQHRPDYLWTADDGGFRATHEDNAPADEIYYLGVIDCLTHYGMIKKIENFWKGLGHDRTQISALPPDQYGDRFYHFIEGVTMSQEAAHLEQQARDAAAAAAAATTAGADIEDGQRRSGERVTSWSSSLRRRSFTASRNAGSHNTILPTPTYQPPPPPHQQQQTSPATSQPPISPVRSVRSPEAEAVMEKATHEARRTEREGAREDDVPDRTLGTVKMSGQQQPPQPTPGPHEPGILPIVEEAAEGASTGGGSSRGSRAGASVRDRDERPETPPKTPPKGTSMSIGVGERSTLVVRQVGPPPTPPKGGYLKPESADSGYGAFAGAGGQQQQHQQLLLRPGSRGSSLRGRISRESLDKELPPLPPGGDGRTREERDRERDRTAAAAAAAVA